MASIAKIELLKLTGLSAATTGDAKSLEAASKDFGAVLKAKHYVSGTIAVKIQLSHNNEDWFDLVTFTAVTANGSEFKAISAPVLTNLRSVVTFTVAG